MTAHDPHHVSNTTGLLIWLAAALVMGGVLLVMSRNRRKP